MLSCHQANSMTNAATTHPLPRPASARPPESRLPGFVQALVYARDPLRFYSRLHRRYGDICVVSFPYFKRVVYIASPELVKRVFTGAPAQFRAGEANATVLEPALGPSSVLTLDGDEHMRQRKSASAPTPRRCATPPSATSRPGPRTGRSLCGRTCSG